MEIITLCVMALLVLTTMAAPVPAGHIIRAHVIDTPTGVVAVNDAYADALATAGRAAAMNEDVEGVEAATYESPVRHLPVIRAPVVDTPAGVAVNDAYADALATAGRAAAVNEYVEGVEAATYESTVRHLLIDDELLVEGGLERRNQLLDLPMPLSQTVFDIAHAASEDTAPVDMYDGLGQDSTNAAGSTDAHRSSLLLEALQSGLNGRYQHSFFWKQSKLPYGFYKVAV